MDLQGKTAVVTGGAHRVGGAISLALAERGCRVVVHFHTSAAQADRTASNIENLGDYLDIKIVPSKKSGSSKGKKKSSSKTKTTKKEGKDKE